VLERSQVGATGPAWALTPVPRILLAGRILWFYAGKLVWPHPLSFQYDRWHVDAGAWPDYFAPLAAVAVVAALWLLRRRIGHGPLVAVACFGVALFPALGFFNVYPMRYASVADHFQYLAAAPLLALGVALAARGLARLGVGAQPSNARWRCWWWGG